MPPARRSSEVRSGLHRWLDRAVAVIAISLVAVSGGLLLELNQQAQAEARAGVFAQSGHAPG